MHKKDYEKFAALLKRTNPYDAEYSITTGKVLDHHVRLITEIAALFKEDNSNFDTQRFINKITSR